MAFQTVPRPRLARRYRQSGPWPDQTFFSILAARAEAHPGREAFADGRQDHLWRAQGAGRALRDVPAVDRDRPRRRHHHPAAEPHRVSDRVLRARADRPVANKVNPDFRTRELEYILRFSDSQAFIYAREFKGFDYVAMARELRARLPSLRHIVVSGDPNDPDAKVWSLEEGIARHAPLAAAEGVAMSPDEIFRMAFTSGTTGDPKCVLSSFNTTLPAVYRLNADMKVTEAEALLGA